MFYVSLYLDIAVDSLEVGSGTVSEEMEEEEEKEEKGPSMVKTQTLLLEYRH